MKWIAANTWLLILLMVLPVILLANYIGWPFNLYSDTQVNYLDKDSVFGVWLLSEGQERTKTIRYVAQAEDNSCFYLYLYKDSLSFPRAGDRLVVSTTVRAGEILGDFDYGRYLRRQGLAGSGFAFRSQWVVVGHTDLNDFVHRAHRWQHYLREQYARMGVTGNALEVLSALTLGYRLELSPQVRDSFSRAGAMHILAVSGLHTGIVWALIMTILSLGGKIKPYYEQKGWRWLMGILGVVILWGYAAITGFSPSVVRSAIMLSVAQLCFVANRKQSSVNILAAAAVLILIVRPTDLWDVGFQLSFAAVGTLILLVARWQQRFQIYHPFFYWLVGMLLVSIGAQLGTMPLSLYYFGQTSNYFLLTNLLVIPLAGIIVPCGLLALLLSFCPVGVGLARVAQELTQVLCSAVQTIEELPGSVTYLSLNIYSVFLLYAAIAMGALMMRGERVHWGWLMGVVLALAGSFVSQILFS